MQHARWGTGSQKSDDLSHYLRSSESTPLNGDLRHVRTSTLSRMSGNMNNVGTTLTVGKSATILLPLARSIPDNISGRSRQNRPLGLQLNSMKRRLLQSKDEAPSSLDSKTLLPNEPVTMTVWFHELASYSQDVVVDSSALADLRVGNVYELQPVRKEPNAKAQKLVFVIHESTVLAKGPVTAPATAASTLPKAKPAFQISLLSSLQKILDIPPRSTVLVRMIRDISTVELDCVEIYLRDVNFSRDSQWSLSSTMVGSCCYVDQKVSYLGNRIGLVKCLFKDGKRLFSGYVGTNTNVIFRSESAKLVFLVQLSREMWHFEENGEIMFHKLVNTLFPMIFKKWRSNNSHHSITIVLFTSVDLTRTPWVNLGGGERPSHCQDYYRVVVDQVSVFIWDQIMANLRLEFANFKRDILLHLEDATYKIKGEPCPSVKANLLEAINMSLTLVSDRYKHTDLRHSINHMIVVTPGTGLFDVDYDLMLETSKKMFSLDCALDIVCLSQPPLHTVPLFRYRSDSGEVGYCVPKWCDMSFYTAATLDLSQWTPRCKIYELQMMGIMENQMSEVQLSRIKFKENMPVIESMDDYDENVFRPNNKKALVTKMRFSKKKSRQFPGAAATISLMRLGNLLDMPLPRATTNVSTTTSSVNGLVTNPSVSNSALSSLYTLNKAGDDSKSKLFGSAKQSNPSTLRSMNSRSSLSLLSKASSKALRVTTEANLKNEIAKSARETKSKKKAIGESASSEKRKSAVEIEQAHRDENNPYWMSIGNPSEPTSLSASQCSRWADVFPPKIRRKMFKWRSLKAPAALPIGTTLFPTSSQMDADYTFQIYVVTLNWENRLELKTTRDLMREMIRLRLAMGFQICYGDKVKKIEAERKSGGYPEGIIRYFPSGDCTGARIYMSLNEEIHRIFFDYTGLLNVQLYRKVNPASSTKIHLGQSKLAKEIPLIRTRYADEYTPSEIIAENTKLFAYNWNQFDQLLAGYEDAVPENMKQFHKMKFVVIPGEMPGNAYHINNERLSDEEIRLEGLRKLIALIERGRYSSTEPRASRGKEEILPEINFYTGNLHDFLNEQAEFFDSSGTKPLNSLMLTDGLRFNMNIRISQLAQELQTEQGLKLVDRTWHFKLHLHCFLGSDLVSWLIKLFEDIDNRETATEYGQMLMDNHLFRHVQNRHGFLDGHYFYEFCDEYVDQSYKNQKGKNTWFRAKKTPEFEENEKEKPFKKEATPGLASNAPGTPLSSHTRNNSDSSSAAETTVELRKIVSLFLYPENSEQSSMNDSAKMRKKKKFLISKQVKYDCDQLQKSFRPELIDVHYDTVHNPEHCFHIRLQWLNTTTKFIDETIISWSRFCEKYGLKLVETPWKELCTIPEHNPYHSFVELKLALNPFTDPEFKDSEILKSSKFYFHLHFLRVADFLLDNRGTAFFLKDTNEIRYSWGKPSFKYAQFIHKTGAYIIELRDNGEFCMAPNNVYILRMNTFINSKSEQTGKNLMLDAQKIMLNFRERCEDTEFLRQVFRDAATFLHEDYDAAYVVGM